MGSDGEPLARDPYHSDLLVCRSHPDASCPPPQTEQTDGSPLPQVCLFDYQTLLPLWGHQLLHAGHRSAEGVPMALKEIGSLVLPPGDMAPSSLAPRRVEALEANLSALA